MLIVTKRDPMLALRRQEEADTAMRRQREDEQRCATP